MAKAFRLNLRIIANNSLLARLFTEERESRFRFGFVTGNHSSIVFDFVSSLCTIFYFGNYCKRDFVGFRYVVFICDLV